MWSLWKLRNEICFQGAKWMGMQVLFFKCAKMLRRWKIIQKPEFAAQLECVAGKLERRGVSPPVITWFPHWREGPNVSRLTDDDDGRGFSSEVVDSVADVIGSSSEADVVLSSETVGRAQLLGVESSPDVLCVGSFVSYE
jgi:hypothetical protein